MNIKKYNEIAEKNKPQKQVLKHTFNAFIVGGIIFKFLSKNLFF